MRYPVSPLVSWFARLAGGRRLGRRLVAPTTVWLVLGTAGIALGAEPDAGRFQREIQPILKSYCFDCHADGINKGGVALDDMSVEALRDHKLWSRVLKNVRAGLMPPAEEDHPLPAAAAEKITSWIKHEAFGLDEAKPDPGRVTVRRLNRVEYRNTIRDLVGVDFDTQKEFPADDTGHGFDNIADVLTISPMLTERYLDAAQAIVAKGVVTKPRTVAEKIVLGRDFKTLKADLKVPEPLTPALTPAAPPGEVVSGAPAVAAPAAAPGVAGVMPNVAGANAPATTGAAAAAGRGQGRGGQGRGGRGGPPPVTRPAPVVEDDGLIMSYYTPATVGAKHTVKQAGNYEVQLGFIAQETYAENLFDLNKCRIVFSLNGTKLLDQEFVREGYHKKFEFAFKQALTAGEHEFALEIVPLEPTPQYRRLRIKLTSVAIRGPVEEPFWVPTPGYAAFFPRNAVPTEASGRRAYAREILDRFATRAFRRPTQGATLDKLVSLAERVYTQPGTSFETGVAQAMVAVLAHPKFLFREDSTEPLRGDQAHPQVDEFSLASRLSYFLWSSMPDEELFRLARERQLRTSLPAQVKRMLADAKAQQFVQNFTGQWLQARDIATVQITADAVYLRDNPNPELEEARETLQKLQAIPNGERTAEQNTALQRARGIVFGFFRQPKPDLTDPLRKAMLDETQLTFAHVLREDRSLLELIDSNYTFLNEALAKHYQIDGVSGSEMRRVELAVDSPRGGVLTQGTVLAVTSNPTRTSPVKRGVFILEAILGTPPAPPPPNIPALEDAASAETLKTLNLRDTLALHAKNALCSSCHSRMDPLGLALENFNALGVWRTADMGQPVQPAGKLATGETFKDVKELKRVLVTARRHDYYHSVAEKLLTYALGRSVEYYDTLTLDQLVADLERSGGKPSALIAGIIASPAFQRRRASAAPTTITDSRDTRGSLAQ